VWQLCEHAHPVLTDEGGAVLDERTGRWTHLTPTAAAAVMLLLASTTTAQAINQYRERYGIGTEQAAADVGAVADTLTGQGLARTTPAPSRRPWSRWWS
jgi:hypothetical protein